MTAIRNSKKEMKIIIKTHSGSRTKTRQNKCFEEASENKKKEGTHRIIQCLPEPKNTIPDLIGPSKAPTPV